MLRGILSRILIGIAILTMVSCDPAPSKKLSGTQDYSNIQFPITVYTYDSREELNKAVEGKKPKGQRVEGLALWFLKKENREMIRCEIHVVSPSKVDDEHTLTWGHELAHCIYGTYHKEPK